MDGDRVLDAAGVAAGEGDHHRDAAGAGGGEDQRVPFLQPLEGERQSAQLVFAVGIGAGEIAEQVRLELAQAGTERVVEPGEVVRVAGAVRQVDVDGGGRLPRRVVAGLVQGDGEDVSDRKSVV